MKDVSLNTTSKYILSTALTVVLTVAGVNAWTGFMASNGDKLDYAKWNQLVSTVQSGIPTGAVMAFNLPSCPTGWTEFTIARGRTIIGVGAGVGLTNRNLGETGGWEGAPIINGTLRSVLYVTSKGPGSTAPTANAMMGNTGTGVTSGAMYQPTTGPATDLVPLNESSVATSYTPNPGASADNMQPYVALLYCVKN